MFKLIVVFVFIAAIHAAPDSRRRTDVNQILRDRIEAFRQQIPQTVHDKTTFYNSYVSKALEFDQGNDSIELTSVNIVGLDDFAFNVLDFKLSEMHLDFSVTFPQINATGTYKLNLTCCDGSGGPYSITLTNLIYTGYALFQTEGEFVDLGVLFAEPSIEHLQLNIEGMFIDKDLNTARNDYLKERTLSTLKDMFFQLGVSSFITLQLQPTINSGPNRLTLSELGGRQATLNAY